ncbi:MAG: Isoleucyl-tRNA synthetase [Actinomycetia bacterium]|nr:Isoleucyl-tRNA synthetase [Actinomycetes bacterium]
MFRPVDPSLDLVALEEAMLARWRDEDVFGESLRRRAGAPEWVFYEGPPTANGRPGIHHVWARLFKDLYPRFHTMRGKHVDRKGGWDCHGLPVEVEVEKELGFSAKFQIEDYGIERFNAKCRASVQRYVEDWQSLTSRIGMWLDTAGAYWTLSNEYIESVWWLFRKIWDSGAIYEGYKVVPYCGRCGTALSSHELGQPGAYRDITEPSVYVRFPLVGRDYDLLVWTTTPWTLPSNVGAAVGPAIDYVRVRPPQGGRDVVMASALVTAVLGPDADVVDDVPVASLVGARYEPPFTMLAVEGERAYTVVADDFVTIDDGSGIVHLAPAFGEIDREIAEREGLPIVNPVNDAARFEPIVGERYAGRFVKDTDPELVDDLAARGKLVAVVDYTHSYPHCWRCDTPLIYWAKPTWFARTSAYKDEMLAENETINWYPEHIKHGRFGDWLENNVDWALSRDRYWGTPIPVWRCHDCGHDTCIGSVAELEKLSRRDLSGMDLHRPYVDDVTISCPECSTGTAYRIEPVLDAWFDSGSMPAAQWHSPFEHEDQFATHFPADFICEAIDQTRGWFYSLLAVNTLAFCTTPYRNVVCLAHIVDQNGVKMSKSRGNIIDPVPILAERGADALRWYMLSSGSPWTPKRVSVEGIDEATRQFLLTLWNTYKFFVEYANIDGWVPDDDAPPVHVLDRWITSRVNRTIRTTTDALEEFDALAATQALSELVDDLSNWYVRRSRPRFWKSSDPVAHATLHRALLTVSQLLAPFTPFVADELFRNLAGTDESVHLADWPEHDEAASDDALEREMTLARTLVSLGRAARADAKLGVRQPLPRAIALLAAGEVLRDDVAREIKDELNVKELEVVDSLEGLLSYRVVPNFRTLGPRLGKLVPRVKEVLENVDGGEVRRAFDEEGSFRVDVDGDEVKLEPGDVEIRAVQHVDLTLAQDGPHAVALDLTLDDDLRAEGIAREIIRVVNDRRKANGFALTDRVAVELFSTDRIVEAATRHAGAIKPEVLATSFEPHEELLESPPDATIDGEPVWLDVRRS